MDSVWLLPAAFTTSRDATIRHEAVADDHDALRRPDASLTTHCPLTALRPSKSPETLITMASHAPFAGRRTEAYGLQA